MLPSRNPDGTPKSRGYTEGLSPEACRELTDEVLTHPDRHPRTANKRREDGLAVSRGFLAGADSESQRGIQPALDKGKQLMN